MRSARRIRLRPGRGAPAATCPAPDVSKSGPEARVGWVRVCSFLPSATEIICDLGLIESLVGVSGECRWPPAVVGKPVVTAARIDPSSLSSVEIDDAVRRSLGDGRSLYTVDACLIKELRPDLIVTQDLCAVCAVSSGELGSACPVGAEVVSLDPRTFADVADSVRHLASTLGVSDRGEEIAARMLDVATQVRAAVGALRRPRVFFAEWLDPPFCAGHWLPEMIEFAGGRDVRGRGALRLRRRGGRRARRGCRLAVPGGRGRRRCVLLASGASTRRRPPAARTPVSSGRRPGSGPSGDHAPGVGRDFVRTPDAGAGPVTVATGSRSPAGIRKV